MNNTFYNYANYLDNIRREQKKTVFDLVDGVCSERAYSRYMNGSRNIPHDTLEKFCEKIGIRYHDFYYSFQKYYNTEYQIIHDLYNLLLRKEYSKFEILNKTMINKKMTENYNSRLLTYLNVRYGIETKLIHSAHGHKLYTDILSSKLNEGISNYDFVDVITLSEMIKIEEVIQIGSSLSKLNRFLLDSKLKYISSTNSHVYPGIYSTVSLVLGKNKKYEDSFNIAMEGIKYSLLIKNNEHLDLLYYLVFCYYNKVENESKKKEYAKLCICTAISKQSNTGTMRYTQLIEKDSGLTLEIKIKED